MKKIIDMAVAIINDNGQETKFIACVDENGAAYYLRGSLDQGTAKWIPMPRLPE